MTDTVTDDPAAAPPPAVALEMLTDEELAILAGPDSIVVSPFLERISAAHRPTAERTAYRGLLARGILDSPSPEALAAAQRDPADDDKPTAGLDVELAVRQDVHAMVALRAAARGVVAIALTTSTGQDFWYAHVVDDVCLLEQVGAEGIHRFALLDSADLPQAVVDAAVHPDAGDADGSGFTFAPSEDSPLPGEFLERLGETLTCCDVVVRTAGDEAPAMTGVFSGPAGTWLFHAQYASEDPVEVEPCTAEGTRVRIRDIVIAALARLAERADGPS